MAQLPVLWGMDLSFDWRMFIGQGVLTPPDQENYNDESRDSL
jgi:hypothetical protein